MIQILLTDRKRWMLVSSESDQCIKKSLNYTYLYWKIVTTTFLMYSARTILDTVCHTSVIFHWRYHVTHYYETSYYLVYILVLVYRISRSLFLWRPFLFILGGSFKCHFSNRLRKRRELFVEFLTYVPGLWLFTSNYLSS